MKIDDLIKFRLNESDRIIKCHAVNTILNLLSKRAQSLKDYFNIIETDLKKFNP